MKRKIFGLNHLSRKIPELLTIQVEDKHVPEKWTWKPEKPEKIKNLKEEIETEREAVNYAAISNYKTTEVRQKVVLVFSMGNLNYSLIKQFEEKGLKYFYLDFVQFVAMGSVNVRIETGNTIAVLTINDLKLDLKDVSVVLWNPPRFPAPYTDFNMIPPIKGREEFLFKKRWSQLLKELRDLMGKGVEWIPSNPLNGSQEWQNKIGEYNLAEKAGLLVPPTLFTNDAKELKKFSQEYGKDLLLREFSTPPFSFPPIPIEIDKVSLDHFEISPSCFQPYIPKLHEYRVVMLFDKVYPCKIYSQDSDLSKHDWRVHDDAKVKWELSTLPEDLIIKLQKLKTELNLNWCSVDLIYGIDEKYYFLEMNRPGAHYWLDLFVGLDITKCIIDEVIERDLAEKINSI
jgi:hypothetical protein